MKVVIAICDGEKEFYAPDCAKCMLEGGDIKDMDKCPLWQCESEDECDPDCAFYTEEWG